MSDETPLNEDAIPVPGPGTEAPVAAAPSPAVARFNTCRWRRDADGQSAAHCTHRDVISIAGVSGFVADSWCADCAYFKVKRVARRPSFQW